MGLDGYHCNLTTKRFYGINIVVTVHFNNYHTNVSYPIAGKFGKKFNWWPTTN